MCSVSLPYAADSGVPPGRLPTLEEIHQSEDVIYELGGRKVVAVGHYAVKYGPQVDLLEGENMMFVAHATSVPVPRIYGLFKDDAKKIGYIIMERIVGMSLESGWHRLSENEKSSVLVQLKAVVKDLRSIPSPGGYCSLGRRPLLDYLVWNDDQPERIDGPFDTEEQLNDAMIKKYLFNNGSPAKAKFYMECFPSILHNHAPTFTHGDFQRKNIVMRLTGDMEDEFELVLLD